MKPSLVTTSSMLLKSLLDPNDQDTWREFDARYRPVIQRFAIKLGLADSDADEAAQSTLIKFAEEYRAGRYERERGRLRSWILSMARTCVAQIHRRRDRNRDWRGESALLDQAAADDQSRIFEEEWRAEILQAAMKELRLSTRTDEKTARSFEMLVLEQKPAEQVAEELGMSLSSVYVAKHRATERLRTILTRLEEEW